MADEDRVFRFSDSVTSFYRDGGVRAAAELLLDSPVAYAPDSVGWDQVETFYDACLAARQIQIEHVKDLFRLWTAVWSGVPEDWIPVSADPGDEELSLDPIVRWENDYFERHFKVQHSKTVALWVVLGDEQRELDDIQIAFKVTKSARNLIKPRRLEVTSALPRWEFKDSAMRFTHPEDYADSLDVSIFKAEADRAILFIDSIEW